MNLYRRKWMERIVARENRIVDSSLISMLSNVATFLASTTVLILGGLVALLGTTDKAVDVMAELPFAVKGTPSPVGDEDPAAHQHLRLRVFQVHVGAAAVQHAGDSGGGCAFRRRRRAREEEDFIARATDVSVYAGENFNNGLRTYYFGLAALPGFSTRCCSPFTTAWVVVILYLREFRSPTLETLAGIHGKGDWEWPPPAHRPAVGPGETPSDGERPKRRSSWLDPRAYGNGADDALVALASASAAADRGARARVDGAAMRAHLAAADDDAAIAPAFSSAPDQGVRPALLEALKAAIDDPDAGRPTALLTRVFAIPVCS